MLVSKLVHNTFHPYIQELGPKTEPWRNHKERGVPRGTTMSASRMVGWMYWSKAGFTNLLYCLMTPSMSRPRSLMSLRRRRTKRMSESVSTKIFRSRSCKESSGNESHQLKLQPTPKPVLLHDLPSMQPQCFGGCRFRGLGSLLLALG